MELDAPAVAKIKDNPADITARLINQFFADKGFNPLVNITPGLLDLFAQTVVRDREYKGSIPFYPEPTKDFTYTGEVAQNSLIDRAIKESERKLPGPREVAGVGASRTFFFPDIRTPFHQEIEALVIGGGAAGIMASYILRLLGIRYQVFDKSGKLKGIWNQQNVKELSKNNPFDLKFGNIAITAAAPGPGTDIVDFLTAISQRIELVPVVTAKVISVEPSDLYHVVRYTDAHDRERITTPNIVINCLGLGKPLAPSRPGVMECPPGQHAGIRWQQKITLEQAKKLRDKTLVFIGLGNSTAEMLVQLEEYNRLGININYYVLTHHSRKAVQEPARVVDSGKSLFRDISIPNLTTLAGDLDNIRAAYYKALYEKRIITDVNWWGMVDNQIHYQVKSKFGKVPCDQLFTLIGYGHDPDMLRNMGMTVTDEYTGSISYDYDGEIHRIPGATGRDRVWAGYFALGALLKADWNPNAEVIPGIMHRLYDMMFSIAVRAAEEVNVINGGE